MGARASLVFALAALGGFAGWTLGSVPLTLGGAGFGALWVAGVTGVCGILAGIQLARHLAPALLAGPDALPRLPERRTALIWGGIGGTLVLVCVILFIPTADARPLWAALLVLAAASLWRGEVRETPDTAPVRIGLAGPLVLAGLLMVLYLVVSRPDADDAFYLSLPLSLIHDPGGMMLADGMYGAADWPFLGSNYRVESLPTLTAALSAMTGAEVVTIAHLVLPLFWCAVWAAVLTVLGSAWFGARGWWGFAALAVLATLAFGGTLQTWGVHGPTRLFHGKGPLLLIVLPMVVFVSWRAVRARTRAGAFLLLLLILQTAALGLTANAIYLAPLTLGLALVSGWAARGFRGLAPVLLLLAALPPVLAGGWLFLFDRPPAVGDGVRLGGAAEMALWNMANSKPTLMLLAATALGVALAARLAGAPQATAFLLAVLLFVLNPFLWPYYDRFVTGGLNFRLWWAIPVPLAVAALATWAALSLPRPELAFAGLAALLAAMALLPGGVIGMGGTRIAVAPLKVPPERATAAGVVAASTPGEAVLAPDVIATWMPTHEGAPPLVQVRRLYLQQSDGLVAEEDLARRRMLADWIEGGEDAPSRLRAALDALCVGLLVWPRGAAPDPALAGEAMAEIDDYTLYRRTVECSP